MKKNVVILCALALIITCAMVEGLMVNTYRRPAKIISYDETSQEAVAIDAYGNVWAWFDDEALAKDTLLVLEIDGNNTSKYEDDKIINVEYQP